MRQRFKDANIDYYITKRCKAYIHHHCITVIVVYNFHTVPPVVAGILGTLKYARVAAIGLSNINPIRRSFNHLFFSRMRRISLFLGCWSVVCVTKWDLFNWSTFVWIRAIICILPFRVYVCVCVFFNPFHYHFTFSLEFSCPDLSSSTKNGLSNCLVFALIRIGSNLENITLFTGINT